MKKFLDYEGLKRFKDYLNTDLKKSKNTDVESGLFYDRKSETKPEVEDGLVTLKNLSYYHERVIEDIKTDGGTLNSTVQSVIADALILKTEDDKEIKSEIYENVETIIDEKMKWKENFPENENI